MVAGPVHAVPLLTHSAEACKYVTTAKCTIANETVLVLAFDGGAVQSDVCTAESEGPADVILTSCASAPYIAYIAYRNTGANRGGTNIRGMKRRRPRVSRE